MEDADVLTKGLTKYKHQICIELLGRSATMLKSIIARVSKGSVEVGKFDYLIDTRVMRQSVIAC